MKAKQRIERLTGLLRAKIPGVTIEIDAPDRPKGDWFVDLKAGDQSFVVVLRPELGFGLSSTPSDGLSEGPDEFHANEEVVVERIAGLLSSAARTQPQRVRFLQELREKKLVSQNALAGKLGIKQPTISKIERREDVNVSTLRRYVQALGGELHVCARFSDGEVEIALGPGAEMADEPEVQSG